MSSCTPKNKSACASSDGRRSRILRGSHHSAKSEAASNCFGPVMRESYQRPLFPPGERSIMLYLGTRFVNGPGEGKPRNGRGRCQKTTTSRRADPVKAARGEGQVRLDEGLHPILVGGPPIERVGGGTGNSHRSPASRSRCLSG